MNGTQCQEHMQEARAVDRTFTCRAFPCETGGVLLLIDEAFKMECLHCHRIDLVSNPACRCHVDLPPIALWQHIKIWWNSRRCRPRAPTRRAVSGDTAYSPGKP
jgi:hypothetical protein